MNLQRLREIREDHDLKQSDIAKLLNITQAQYCRCEMGINLISLEKISKLADYYHVSVDYLIGKTDKREPYPKSILNK